MQAIIFADRTGEELAPINRQLPPALLPISGKRLIEHNLELCLQHGASEIIIVVAEQRELYRKILGDGERWSCQISYVLSRPNEHPHRTLFKLGDELQYPCLALRGDVVNMIDQHVMQIPDLVTGRSTDLSHLHFNNMKYGNANSQVASEYLLLSISDYFDVALAPLKQQSESFQNSGMKKLANLSYGKNSSISHRSVTTGQVFVGNFSQVAPSTKLSGAVYIGENCVIDQGAELENCIILDNTYIGSGVTITNAIVIGNQIIRTDIDSQLTIVDPFLTHGIYFDRRRPSLERGLDCIALLLLLPVLLVLVAMHLLQSLFSNKPVFRQVVSDDGKHYRLFNHSHPLVQGLALMPLLWQREVALFGRNINQEMTPPCVWTQPWNGLPLGIFAPTPNATTVNTAEERQLWQLTNRHQHWFKRWTTNWTYVFNQLLAAPIVKEV